MKRGPNITIDWPRLAWRYSNRSLARLLDCAPETIARMRVLHAPETSHGPGKAPPDAYRDRSGEHASEAVLRLAGACRQVVRELGAGAVRRETVREVRRLLEAVERGGVSEDVAAEE